ncbi:hypothetical protein ACIF6L_35040 [Kitasatospora sp. NPDC086009]|uniref:hypothetical protein n=1 Tax=unclassified Kitasatospora TaxID=2633591 RepID=UPI0037C8578B
MTTSPRYRRGDLLEEAGGRLLRVLAVGDEAYFLRRLDDQPGRDIEPAESAWAFAGCEDATHRIRMGADETTGA